MRWMTGACEKLSGCLFRRLCGWKSEPGCCVGAQFRVEESDAVEVELTRSVAAKLRSVRMGRRCVHLQGAEGADRNGLIGAVFVALDQDSTEWEPPVRAKMGSVKVGNSISDVHLDYGKL